MLILLPHHLGLLLLFKLGRVVVAACSPPAIAKELGSGRSPLAPPCPPFLFRSHPQTALLLRTLVAFLDLSPTSCTSRFRRTTSALAEAKTAMDCSRLL